MHGCAGSMAGTWHWQADIQTSPDPAVRRVDMRVFAVDPDDDRLDEHRR